MNNKKYDTKGLVESGILTTIIVIMALMNIYVPAFFVVGKFILPIPVVIVFLRYNLKNTISSLIISGIIITFIYNPLYALTSTFMFGSTGIALGYCIKNKRKVSITLTILALVFLLGNLLEITVYAKLIANTSILALVEDMVRNMRQSFEQVMSFYKSMGVNEQQLKPLIDMMKLIDVNIILLVLPAMFITSAFIFSYLTYIITKFILNKLGYNYIDKVPNFMNIHINIKVATIVAIFLLMGVILTRKNIEIGKYILSSSQLLLQYIFLIQGLSVVYYYLRNKFNMSKRFIILILIFTLFSRLQVFYFVVGFADLIADFRKLDSNRRIRNK